jgi:superfamily I DNA and/or RNA helicase
MHPSIADLVRQTLYPKLKDHISVKEFPQVSGIRRRLFWLDHQEKESGADAAQPNQVSHWNSYEVEMVAALVSHLIRQGTYKSQEIAVITPYLLQLRKIRKRLSSTFEIVIGDRDLEDMEKEGLDESETDLTVNSTARKVTLLNALRVATVGT